MICSNCKKIKTNEPDGVCGFCKLQDTLEGYKNAQKIRDAVLNMPRDEVSQDKQVLVDSDRVNEDYNDEFDAQGYDDGGHYNPEVMSERLGI
jgi:hypothetical protein